MPLNANEQYMLELINAERVKVGAPALAFDATLVRSSEAHSQWMIGTDTFSHTGVNGSSPGDRMHDAGYTTQAGWGENIAWASLRGAPGTRDEVELLHTNLMNSPGHRANILRPEFGRLGIGIMDGGARGLMVTQNFRN
jgi:serralysin